MDKIQPVNNLRQQTIAFQKTANKLPLVENKEGNVGRAELRVEHDFSFGVYARTVYIPKDCALVGHIHKYDNLNILIKGHMSVSIDGQMKEIKAPFKIVSPAGIKRIAWALEDSIWMTIHGTYEKDLNIIEQTFIAHNEEEYLKFIGANQLQLGLDR